MSDSVNLVKKDGEVVGIQKYELGTICIVRSDGEDIRLPLPFIVDEILEDNDQLKVAFEEFDTENYMSKIESMRKVNIDGRIPKHKKRHLVSSPMRLSNETYIGICTEEEPVGTEDVFTHLLLTKSQAHYIIFRQQNFQTDEFFIHFVVGGQEFQEHIGGSWLTFKEVKNISITSFSFPH